MSSETTGHILWPYDKTPHTHICDCCLKEVYEVTQTKEGEWICKDCLADQICEMCGVISDEVTRIRISAGAGVEDLVDLCPKCREKL